MSEATVARKKPTWLLGVLAFTVAASISLSVVARLTPLAFIAGSADGGEWFELGKNLATHGVVGYGQERWVHRPPGYPAWLAMILKLAVDPRTTPDDVVNANGPLAIHIADSILLGLSSLVLFFWLSRRLHASTAFAAAVLLGTNAYALVTATLIHYDMLQWAILIGLCFCFDAVFRPRAENALVWFFTGGLLLGLATLIRPVTLLAPVSFLGLFGRHPTRRAALGYLALVLGMALAIAPWTLRNFAVAGRIIPVNVQGWTAVFGSTSEVARHDPDRYEWSLLTHRHYMPIFTKITGEPYFQFAPYVRNIVALEDAAKEAAIANITSKPRVYLSNVVKAAVSLNTEINAVLLSTFTRIQSGEPFDRRWILLKDPTAMRRGPEATVFQWLHSFLVMSAVCGLGLAAFRRDSFLAPAAALWAAIVAAYALAYLDFFYYSIKMPFLIAFAFYGLDALPRALRYGLVIGISALSLGLSWSMRLLA